MTASDRYVAKALTMALLSRRIGFTAQPIDNEYGGYAITCPDPELLVTLHNQAEQARANELSVLVKLILDHPLPQKDT